MNDMLHATMGQPQEFRLTVNLRSPRRIADVVNRAWDLYDYLHKQDRPSGTGYAEIDDDSPDQILYAAVPGAEMAPLLTWLSGREGLAMIAFDKKGLPAGILPFVLSPAEAKGLDFNSVCVLNGGTLLRHIVNERASTASDALGRRLAIDQLRVALSRATERLLWVDADPDAATVREAGGLLRAPDELILHPVNAEALRTCLEEEELDIEERLQRCEKDARQLVDVKPDLAWSRAQQAVALLGQPGDLNGVADQAARDAAHMTLAEVSFQLAFRKKVLSPELGKLDLYLQSSTGARMAQKHLLGGAILAIGAAEQTQGVERLNRIATAIQRLTSSREELPAWLVVELMPRTAFWLDELEHHLEAGDNPVLAQEILPPFFDALSFPDAQARKDRLAQRSVQILMKARRFEQALSILERLPQARPKLAAECYEETGQFAKAASIWLELGERDKALKCYRSVPDFEATLDLVRKIDGHAARPSLEWVAELDAVLARRPDNFNRVMTVPEKKLLEAMLERGLGVQRKKPAAKKKAPAAATKKKAAAKKPREIF
jgi:tetratricopeptide (TPR) repeat protein